MTIHQCKPPVIKGNDDHTSIITITPWPSESLDGFDESMEEEVVLLFRPTSSPEHEWVVYVEGKDGHFPTQADGKVFAKASRNRCCAGATHLRHLFDSDGVAVFRGTHVLLRQALHGRGAVARACGTDRRA